MFFPRSWGVSTKGWPSHLATWSKPQYREHVCNLVVDVELNVYEFILYWYKLLSSNLRGLQLIGRFGEERQDGFNQLQWEADNAWAPIAVLLSAWDQHWKTNHVYALYAAELRVWSNMLSPVAVALPVGFFPTKESQLSFCPKRKDNLHLSVSHSL